MKDCIKVINKLIYCKFQKEKNNIIANIINV